MLNDTVEGAELAFEIGNQIANQNKLDQIFSVAGGGDTFALINKINILIHFF